MSIVEGFFFFNFLWTIFYLNNSSLLNLYTEHKGETYSFIRILFYKFYNRNSNITIVKKAIVFKVPILYLKG